jgi:hypothetical protein
VSSNVEPFVRSLEQELLALMRGASLECPVCGEFVMHARDNVIFCPECSCIVGAESAIGADRILDPDVELEFRSQAG